MKEILGAIEGADVFLFVISPESCASHFCRREIEHAAANNKRLIPISFRQVDYQSLPAAIAAIQAVSFAADDFEIAFTLLLKAIDSLAIRSRVRVSFRVTGEPVGKPCFWGAKLLVV
jgi:hypothetical protein